MNRSKKTAHNRSEIPACQVQEISLLLWTTITGCDPRYPVRS